MEHNYISYSTLGSMIYRWGKFGLSDSSISKMLQLWSGYILQDLLDEQGQWSRQELWQVAKRLGYKTTLDLLTDVRRTRFFQIEVTAKGEVLSVASPVWNKSVKKSLQNAPQNGSGLNNTSINNPTGSNDTPLVDDASTPELWELKRDNAAARRIVADYFAWLQKQTDANSTALMRQLLELCKTQELLRILIDTQLIPYLSEQKNFFKNSFIRSPDKRFFWLRNLFKPRFVSRMVTRAQQVQKQLSFATAADAHRIQQDAYRQHHPLSLYEWSDPDGQRFYDYQGTTQAIPAQADPRPTQESVYNFIANQWIQPS